MTSKVTNALAYVFLTIAAVLSVFPLVWMIIASTNRSVDVIAGKLTFGGNLAVNYSNLISAQDVWKFFMNSGKYAILTTVLSLLVCSMAGYAFEIFHDIKKMIVNIRLRLKFYLDLIKQGENSLKMVVTVGAEIILNGRNLTYRCLTGRTFTIQQP